jgi:hypothetical protein
MLTLDKAFGACRFVWIFEHHYQGGRLALDIESLLFANDFLDQLLHVADFGAEFVQLGPLGRQFLLPLS